MVDRISVDTRSENMRRIRNKNTAPELYVRKLVYSLGYRYRLHVRSLPGCPDLVFGGRRKIVFVHGCFWHQHEGCRDAHVPKSRLSYWQPKLHRNVDRDAKSEQLLADMGWKILTVWACEITDAHRLLLKLREFLA
jgi:DNA mismatch endonuclease, patch repair protein